MGLFDRITNRKEILEEVAELRRTIRRLKRESAQQAGGMRSIAGLEEKVIQLDDNDNIEYINSALANSLGINRNEVVTRHVKEIDIFEWGPGLFQSMIVDARDQKLPVSVERTYFDAKQDKEVHIRIRVTVDDGKPQILIQDLTDLRNLEQMFARFVSPAVIQKMRGLKRDFFKAERKNMTVLFADLRGFTSVSEGMEPEMVRDTINEYLATMINIIDRHEATLDKVVGDEVMALFGAPIPDEDHAISALKVAIDFQRAQEELIEKWRRRGSESLKLGVGINTGEMMVGNIGSDKRMQYTVLGHHVNLGHRLVEAAKPGQILISQNTFDSILSKSEDIKGQMRFNVVGCIRAKGISKPVEVIEVVP
ncbi:MAG: adenylate/guanylate cyclase domain-containing protein [Planctomycetota bacterium]|jgi:class 3 adenylate cyclase